MYGTRWRRAPPWANPFAGRTGVRRRAGGALLVAAAIALMGVLGWLSRRTPDDTGVSPPATLTREQEETVAQEEAPALASRFGGIVHEPLAEYVADVGARVAREAADDARTHEFFVLADARNVRTFALPGGRVYVTVALLRALGSEAELAAILGHQVGHLQARHGLEQVVETGATEVRYSRAEEREADELGVKLMAAAGYDPTAMIAVMKRLPRTDLAESHPSPANRIVRLREWVNAYQAAPGGGELGEERYRDNVLLPLGEARTVRGED